MGLIPSSCCWKTVFTCLPRGSCPCPSWPRATNAFTMVLSTSRISQSSSRGQKDLLTLTPVNSDQFVGFAGFGARTFGGERIMASANAWMGRLCGFCEVFDHRNAFLKLELNNRKSWTRRKRMTEACTGPTLLT